LTLVILVEEPSMKAALSKIVLRLGGSLDDVKIISHQGVNDLKRSLPKKLRAWTDPSAQFLVLRDNDNGNCMDRKNELIQIAEESGKLERTTVRIVCQELESWFLGDLAAIETAYSVPVSTEANNRKYRDPDKIEKPSRDLKSHINNYRKIEGAERIAEHLNLHHNKSQSFLTTINSLRTAIMV